MRQLRAWLVRLGNLFGRKRSELELSDEISSNLQFHIDDNARAGMSPEEARRQALLKLGGIEQAKEIYRDGRGLAGLEGLFKDVRFGMRMLRKHSAFTAVAVLTLAIGLGTTTAVFTMANWIALRPIPGVQNSQALSLFMTGAPSRHGGLAVSRISYPNYDDIVARLRTIRLAGYQDSETAVAGDQQAARFMRASFVTDSYFEVLGVEMLAGRPFTAMEDDAGNPALVAVISDRLWASMFQRDLGALGQDLLVNGQTVSIVELPSKGV